MRRRDAVDPAFDALGPPVILLSGVLHSRLKFAEGNRRDKDSVRGDARQPGGDTAMRPGATQRGYDVGVEQVHYLSSGGDRQRHRLRSGISSSKRGSGASSSSLSVGRARCCSLRHSLIGTRTAVSTPRFVTICGPSVTLFYSNSLNRALASCTGQLISASVMTSYLTSHHH